MKDSSMEVDEEENTQEPLEDEVTRYEYQTINPDSSTLQDFTDNGVQIHGVVTDIDEHSFVSTLSG